MGLGLLASYLKRNHMFRECNMRIMLGFLLILYGFGLLVWTLYTRLNKRETDKFLVICDIALILLGILSISLKILE